MLRTKVCLAEHGICKRINHQHGLPDERLAFTQFEW
jgi:hypothetical protein